MNSILQPEFITRLLKCRSILLAGAGGGFDIFCGLPLFFALREAGISVHLSSFSFSFRHGEMSGRKLGENIVEVTANSRGNEYYFPEGYLAKWLSRKRMDQSIFCLRPGPPPQLFPISQDKELVVIACHVEYAILSIKNEVKVVARFPFEGRLRASYVDHEKAIVVNSAGRLFFNEYSTSKVER